MALAFVIIIAAGALIPTLTIDSRSEVFLPEDDPALLYRAQVEETFGLIDLMVENHKTGHQTRFTFSDVNTTL